VDPKHEKSYDAMGATQWEAIGMSMVGGPYASCHLPSHPVASEIMGDYYPNREVVNSFFIVLFLMEGKRVNA
jgi:hypothetical protein